MVDWNRGLQSKKFKIMKYHVLAGIVIALVALTICVEVSEFV